MSINNMPAIINELGTVYLSSYKGSFLGGYHTIEVAVGKMMYTVSWWDTPENGVMIKLKGMDLDNLQAQYDNLVAHHGRERMSLADDSVEWGTVWFHA
jgi:hypothetical protein